METLGEQLLKSFTRYLVPGLVFYSAVACLPVYLYQGLEPLTNAGLLSVLQVTVLSTVFGYLLDSIGAYGWHLHRREYRRERAELARRLSDIKPSQAPHAGRQGDPDQHIATLWLTDEKLYERIQLERAEWVAILEVASALLMSAAVILSWSLTIVVSGRAYFSLGRLAIIVALVLISYAASAKGIQRMAAHNTMLLAALRRVSAAA